MQKYILNRLLQGIVLLFIVALIVFALARATGNPADLMVPEDATEEERQFIERNLGLDRPYHVQLFVFLTGIVRGDFGDSLVYKKPAAELFFERLPNTLKLLPLSMLIAVGVDDGVGVIAAGGVNVVVVVCCWLMLLLFCCWLLLLVHGVCSL